MLLRDEVVADRQAEPHPLTRRFGREEGLEQPAAILGRAIGAGVADGDRDGIGQSASHNLQDRPETLSILARPLAHGAA